MSRSLSDPAESGGARLNVQAAVAGALATVPRPPDRADEDSWFAYSVRVQRHLYDYGLVGLEWPIEYGGQGLDPVAAAAVMRALGAAGVPELANFVGIDVLAPALIANEPAERLGEWLPAMAQADQIWCQLFSEPDAGSDLASLRTRARPDGDSWVVTGPKIWSTWAHRAQWGVLLARTGTLESRHKGITAFVVDMSAPGITTRPLRTMTGAAHFGEVFLDEVRLPADSVIGAVNDGWRVTLQILESERGPYAASRGAVLRRVYEHVRGSLGPDVGPELRRRLARVGARLDALDAAADSVLNRLSAGEPVGPEAAVSKVLLSRTEQLLHDTAYAALGPAGVIWDGATIPHEIQEFLYSVAATIYGGTRNIQLNIIGERALGLPR